MSARGLVLRALLALALLSLLLPAPSRAFEHTQEHSSEPAQAAPEDKSIGGELAKETREAAEEENENLKHSAAIRYLAKKSGMTVHQAHMVAVGFNFLLIAFLIYWFARKTVPAALAHPGWPKSKLACASWMLKSDRCKLRPRKTLKARKGG